MLRAPHYGIRPWIVPESHAAYYTTSSAAQMPLKNIFAIGPFDDGCIARSVRRNVSEAFCQPSEFLSVMGEKQMRSEPRRLCHTICPVGGVLV